MFFKRLIFLVSVFLIGVKCTPRPKSDSFSEKKVSIESSCFNQNKSFIGQYFKGESEGPALDSFFDCVDNLIQALLNHTQTEDPEYYTQKELSRFILYMGGVQQAKTEAKARSQAQAMSQALLDLKAGFIGGSTQRLTLKEIELCRKILSVFRNRMRALWSFVPSLLEILKGAKVSKNTLFNTIQVLKDNLKTLAKELSSLSFSADLSLLQKAPENIKTLTGISSQALKYWPHSVLILAQWQKMFGSSGEVITPKDWPTLLKSFGDISALWLYHNRFLKGTFYLDYSVVPNTQYFLSQALDLVIEALKPSHHKHITLKDMDELARRIWFLPVLSQPVFRLGLRTVSCFLLKPLSDKKVCEFSTSFEKTKVTLHFSDRSFTVTEDKKIQELEKIENVAKEQLMSLEELQVLNQYLSSWSQAEQKIREGKKTSLFGAPHKWLGRKIGVIGKGALAFNVEKRDDKALLSRLNWQSHVMQLSATAYTNRGEKALNQELWNNMIKEWTTLAVALYPPLKWESFQSMGFQVFSHGDFMVSSSNGDAVLQAEELLELFSLYVSSADLLLSSLELAEACKGEAYSLSTSCLFDILHTCPLELFAGFPSLTQKMTTHEETKTSYIDTLKTVYGAEERIKYKDIFKIFLVIHYQENMMEYLDTSFDFHLDVGELTTLMPVFEKAIIDNISLFNNTKEAFAFITYLFHYGEWPIFGQKEQLSAPVRFSHWLLHPEKWHIQADQHDLLKVIVLVNNELDSFM